MKNFKLNTAKIKMMLIVMIICFGFSCKKLVEVDTPVTSVSTESAFKDNSSATSVLTGIYAQLSNTYYAYDTGSLPSISFYGELASDNFTMFNPDGNLSYSSFYKNALEPKYTNSGLSYWTKTYALLYTTNAAIEGLSTSNSLNQAVKNRLLGEALFLRSFFYFYLLNLYGDVPLVLDTKYVQNSNLPRASVVQIYQQIETDLTQASTLLDFNYVSSDVTQISQERVRPNLAAVYGLQARVYLYEKKYSQAEAACNKIIDLSGTYSLIDLNKVFLKNSQETIWSLQPVILGYNTQDGSLYNLPSTGLDPNQYPVYASTSLVNSFELGDNRKNAWLGKINDSGNTYYYPAKYKIPYIDGSKNLTEYLIVMRLAEIYLIRAEASNELGNSSAAIADLNKIRARSRAQVTSTIPNPLPNLSSSLTQDELRTAILNERRVELFSEWAHRWFDLKRSATIDSVMTEAEKTKGGTWSSYKVLFPVPLSDILLDSKLTQNPGYTN